MTPFEYVDEIAIPTLKDALKFRDDRRRAYLACITAFHVIDHVSKSRGVAESVLKGVIKARCEPSFAIVQGIANGSKHAGGSKNQWVAPGSERTFPVFALNTPGAGFGHSRWSVPGLAVEHHGHELFVDWCAQVFLLVACQEFRPELDLVDLSFMDAAILQNRH